MASKRKPKTRTDASDFSPTSKQQTQRNDEFGNVVTGHNVAGRDPRTVAIFHCDRVSHQEARDLWAGDPLARKLVELLPKAMVREGYKIKVADAKNEKDLTEAITDAIDTLAINKHFVRAKEYERAYGGAAIWPVLNDGIENLATPLDETSIATVRCYQVFEPRELIPDTWYREPSHPKFGKPETWRVTPITGGVGFASTQHIIHETRLVIFEGVRVSRELPTVESLGWGDSELTRVRATLRDYHLDWASVHALFKDLSQGVYKYKGLTEMLGDAEGEVVVKRKLALNDYSKSVFNALALDADDDYERKNTPVSGADSILQQLLSVVAAAFGMPVTKLFGISPGGLNATGDSDTRGWYETVSEEQEDDRPLLEQLIRFSLLAIDGPTGGKEPAQWCIEFAPLWMPSAKEQAETRYIVQQADTAAIDAQMVTAEEVAKARWGGDTYSADMHIDWAEREKQLKAGEEAIAASAAMVKSTDIATALLDIISQAVAGKISRESATQVLVMAFGMDATQAEALLGPEDFEATQPVSPFGAPNPDDPNADPAAAKPPMNGKPMNGAAKEQSAP